MAGIFHPGQENVLPHPQRMATHFSILAWKTPRNRGAWRATVHGVAKSHIQLSMHARTYPQNTLCIHHSKNINCVPITIYLPKPVSSTFKMNSKFSTSYYIHSNHFKWVPSSCTSTNELGPVTSLLVSTVSLLKSSIGKYDKDVRLILLNVKDHDVSPLASCFLE